FFFQAEDGIRDRNVTGVQTCALPIFQKLVNQGMIQGRSNFVYRIKDTNTFVSLNLKDQYDTTPLHVDVNIVSNDVLDLEAFKARSEERRVGKRVWRAVAGDCVREKET